MQLLREGRPLRLKMGFDPSRSDIHLGHAVGLRKLRQLQELGHKVVLIIGDWTAQIGDPSGQSATRPMMTAEEVRENAKTYMEQFFKIVDKERTEAVWQTEWFGKFTLEDVIKLTSKFTVAQFLARDDFASRYKAQRPIAISELLYPLMQAYDSVAVESDVEFGGTDQKFNLLVGRQLQAMMGQRPQQCFLMPILPGTDGVQKMSKSLGNYIGITEPPSEMYGKTMSLPDNLIMEYMELLTDVPDEELEEMRQAMASDSINPMDLKKRLARELVAQFHDVQAAGRAEAQFEQVFQRREAPDQAVEARLSFKEPYVDIPDLLVSTGLAASKTEAKRLLKQRAITLDSWVISEETVPLRVGDAQGDKPVITPGALLKVGRRRFLKIVDSGAPLA